MLAVQARNPTMDNPKPPEYEMPFGYSFDTPQNFPLPSPTAPAPGPSLLDDNESKYLENFFDGVSNEQFDYNDMFLNAPDGSELGLGWGELPPTLMGATTSYGQQPPMNHLAPPLQNYGHMNPHMNARPMVPPSTSADVLEAATVLQNGSAGRSHSMVDGALFGAHDMLSQPPNGAGRSHSLSQYPPPRQNHGLPQRALGENFYRHTYYHDMVFGADPEEAASRRHAAQKNVEIQWGSDTRFASPHSFATDHHEKLAASERSHLQMLDSAFRLDTSNISSAENTQPSSPVHTRTKSNTQNNEDDEDSRPRKRRKSKYQEEENDEDVDTKPAPSTSKQNGKKRKPVKKAQDESPAPETAEQSHKRRKSAAASAAAAKATRENLTEDQKRENHIKSEQKRRSLIKEGFDDLNELVPGLRGGGFSKSAVLIMAADWLEQIMQGNEELRARLEAMEGS